MFEFRRNVIFFFSRHINPFPKSTTKFIIILAIIILLLNSIPNIFDKNRKTISTFDWFNQTSSNSTATVDSVLAKTDAYLINAYYYPYSKSLGENALGMILLLNRNTQKELVNYTMKLIATDRSNHSILVVPKLLQESYSNCQFVNVVAISNTLPHLQKLEVYDGNATFQIPFRMGRKKAPAPVIICISPLFVAEQWQTFVAHVHVSKVFGGHLHLYITSMIDSFFDLVQEYQKLGYVTVDFWNTLTFSSKSKNSINPNLHSELRNQAGAYSDCLYQYKEVASFITFFDLDDILIPRGFNSYFEEFSALYFSLPQFLTFQYTKREMQVFNKAKLNDINLVEMLGHTWFVNEESYGKMMAKPENLNSMWIHQSFNIPIEQHHVSGSNYILHLHKPVESDGTDPIPYRTSNFQMIESMRLNKSHFNLIQQDFNRIQKLSDIDRIADKLPAETYYFRTIYRCYFEEFYKSPNKNLCPNGEGCLVGF